MKTVELIQAGYRCRPPDHKTGEIDAEVVAEMTCDACGSEMQYEPWSKVGSYVAMAVCKRCGYVIEF